MFLSIKENKDKILEYYKSHKSREKTIVLICPYCHKNFITYKHYIQMSFSPSKNNDAIYCSKECCRKSQVTEITLPCGHCGKEVTRDLREYKKSKSGYLFCNSSCACSYNNTHKTTGSRRSKLEVWLEEKLQTLYPSLDFLFNDKTTINSELDIYIPSLKLAFELNGIFHYEPIFGDDKLNQIQNNDANKFQLCQQNQISLCIIDVSWISYNKESNFQKVLDIITDIINKHFK